MVGMKEKAELAISELLDRGSNVYFFTCSPFRNEWVVSFNPVNLGDKLLFLGVQNFVPFKF